MHLHLPLHLHLHLHLHHEQDLKGWYCSSCMGNYTRQWSNDRLRWVTELFRPPDSSVYSTLYHLPQLPLAPHSHSDPCASWRGSRS